MSIKKIIVNRVIAVYLTAFLFAVLIIGRILHLQFIKGDELRQKAEEMTLQYVSINPNRGDIYADDGKRLLATSVPYYEIRLDLRSDGLTDRVFQNGIDSLSYNLSVLFRDKSPEGYKRELVSARRKGKRYYLLKREVSYKQLKEMKRFPIFRLGRFKGGFITIQNNKRILPHQILAARTIGYLSRGASGNVVGVEGAYEHYLRGITGYRLMQKTAGNLWIPVSDANEVEPQNGYDVITTINIDIQDVAENALLEQLERHNAHHGCAVLMEVKTGEIKAIANLQRGEDGLYRETYNYAIAESTEPGSTFKLASLIAALEDGYIDIYDTTDTGKGTVRFYDKEIRDTKKDGYGKITVKEAFEVSSNVGVSNIIYQLYKGREHKFVDRLYRMHLNESLGIDIKGEGQPVIRYPDDEYWSGISLAMMSQGYEVRLTPLQLLAFYNAIANDGKMVKPMIVKRITNYGKIIKEFDTEVIDPSICSRSTLHKARIMLEGVVENGTAMNLKNENFRIAGKTGTAQIAYNKQGYRNNSGISHQASFVGYFPANQPEYSCIVVVNAPSSDVYYGNLVAGPVFREVANKVYANSLNIHKPLERESTILADIPYSKHGSRKDLVTILDQLEVPWSMDEETGDWITTRKTDDHILCKPIPIIKNRVPNVLEMGLKDAVSLLESAGLKVEVKGRGKVVQQSLLPGTRITGGELIVLTMSFI